MSLPPGIERFDAAVDRYFDSHLRGRPASDWLMYAASAAGEHSACWLVLAAAYGLRHHGGTRAASQAFLRAGVVLGAESALVNGLIKSVFRRVRPANAEPHPLPLRVPRTSSFPSGHASAAFVAAALLRDDPLWPLVYALATVVATSRVHVRMHHASDVVAGAAVGAALGELSRHLLPLKPRRPTTTVDNIPSLWHR
jgi:undecaprenyl-diphosphatase